MNLPTLQNYRLLAIALLTPTLLLAGCRAESSAARTQPGGAIDPATLARSQGYALLYATVRDDSQVDKSMMFKDPEPAVAELLKATAHLCTQATETLESFAKSDPTLYLKSTGLPAMELKARDSISSELTKKIIFGGGRDYEFTILQTQEEALNYIMHLSSVLAKGEPDATKKSFLTDLSKKADMLKQAVVLHMKTPYLNKPK